MEDVDRLLRSNSNGEALRVGGLSAGLGLERQLLASRAHNHRLRKLGQELRDRLHFSQVQLKQAKKEIAALQVRGHDRDAHPHRIKAHRSKPMGGEEGADGMQVCFLEDQLAAAQIEIKALRKQLKHSSSVKHDIAGELEVRRAEACSLHHTARMFHTAQDEVVRLRKENGELRGALQAAATSMHTGASQAGPSLAQLASLLAEDSQAGHCYVGASESQLLESTRVMRTGGGFAALDSPASSPSPGSSLAGSRRGAWVPARAVEVVTGFVRRLSLAASAGEVQGLIVLLDKVYARREGRRIARVQARHQQVLSVLRRRAQQAQPYSSVLARQRIARLKHMLTQALAARGSSHSERMVHFALEKALHLARQLDTVQHEKAVLIQDMERRAKAQHDSSLHWQRSTGLKPSGDLLKKQPSVAAALADMFGQTIRRQPSEPADRLPCMSPDREAPWQTQCADRGRLEVRGTCSTAGRRSSFTLPQHRVKREGPEVNLP
ncbi:hypothetical protein WJX72_003940 [[Myrmecia] bisecta]|uniref:Uncharacterized protein n=1 Tax=[Myrmecia] bisecta TaxID=41462 RepID=A0AAW1PMI5_9CHLO